MKINTFRKGERLKSDKRIQHLFEAGKSAFSYPLKAVYVINPKAETTEEKSEVKAAVSVSRRIYKKAVDRNLVKRRIREQFRTRKSQWATHYEGLMELMFIYVAKEILPSEDIGHAIEKLQKKIFGDRKV